MKKKINLKEARHKGAIQEFTKQHKSTGDKQLFARLLTSMAGKPKATRGASSRGSSAS